MSQKVYLLILKSGIYLSLICVFFVFKDLLFPFITSKQISFNILIEILLIFWVGFIVKYPEYRPKGSYISFGLLAFFAAILASCFVTVDFNLSFWGDIERMLGIFHLLHFLAYYFIIITVLRSEEDWKIFFIFSIICATLISLIGIGKETHSQIGNTAYVSAYLIFNIYFSLLLFFREKNNNLKWLYLIPIPIMLLSFNKADTTGAYVGLGLSIIVMLFLYAVLSANKKLKISAIAIAVALVVLTGVMFANKNSEFVRNAPVLSSLSEIDFQKNTFQTRLISWRAAFKDFKTHPILGTGYGNYAIVFDKYFEPQFYNYTRSETYFDRAHNNLIDIASTTGLLGLLTYLSIFVAAAFYLVNGYLEKKIGTHEFIMLFCLFTAYFIQNLAVFDAFVTYMALMAVLGYIYWLYGEGAKDDYEIQIQNPKYRRSDNSYFDNSLIEGVKDRPMENKETYFLIIAGIIFLTIVYQYNIKPLKMLKLTIDGQMAFAKNDIEEAEDVYKKALSINTPLDRDSRSSFVRTLAERTEMLDKLSKERRNEILDYTIFLADENIKYNPQDSMNQMILAQILDIAASYNRDDAIKFEFYSNRALEAIENSVAASPGRIPIYFQKAQILANRGEKEKSVETLQYAVSLNEIYFDSYCYLGRAYLISNQEKESYNSYSQCLDLGGVNMLTADTIKYLINYYSENKDLERMTILFENLVKKEPNVTDNWIKIAVLYKMKGDMKKAEEAVAKAVELDPNIAKYAEDFLK
ncbi:MAG: O-antigen ligase family protein [bacterium]